MIAFTEVTKYMRNRRIPPVTRQQVNELFGDFRRGMCYLHPVDVQDHEIYFQSSEEKLHALFLSKYTRRPDGLHHHTGLMTFDDDAVDLADLGFMLDHFLQYEREHVSAEAMNAVSQQGIAPALKQLGATAWVAYLVCRDHEGWTCQALYSKTLSPVEGAVLLHYAMRFRFGILPAG